MNSRSKHFIVDQQSGVRADRTLASVYFSDSTLWTPPLWIKDMIKPFVLCSSLMFFLINAPIAHGQNIDQRLQAVERKTRHYNVSVLTCTKRWTRPRQSTSDALFEPFHSNSIKIGADLTRSNPIFLGFNATLSSINPVQSTVFYRVTVRKLNVSDSLNVEFIVANRVPVAGQLSVTTIVCDSPTMPIVAGVIERVFEFGCGGFLNPGFGDSWYLSAALNGGVVLSVDAIAEIVSEVSIRP
jgi:hypothetical protein